MAKVVRSFQGQYRFLSNFYPCVIQSGGIDFKSVEAAYQAAKTTSRVKKLTIAGMTAGQAKRAGRKLQLRSDWEDIKVEVMRRLVLQKFLRSFELARLLLQTGYAELIEGNDWGDTFWGECLKTGEGHNWLGKILMEVRAELRKGTGNGF